MAHLDGGVFGVGFVYVGEDGCELRSVVGYLKDVELSLADEVGRIAWGGGYVSWLVEPDRGSVALWLSGGLRRTEGVVELLVEPCDGSVGLGLGGLRLG